MYFVETRRHILVSRIEQIGVQVRRQPADAERVALKSLRQISRHLLDFVAPIVIRIIDAEQHLLKRGHPAARLVREIGPAVKRATIRQQKDRHRPAAMPARERLHRLHVNVVNIGAFLAIHLDVDVQFVHQAGGRFVLEALVRHHVTPVTGAVADAQQDRLIFAARPLERFVRPGIPVHRVIGVLPQIRAGLIREMIHASP